MGIQDLFKVIKERCPDCLIPCHLSQLRGYSLAVDVSIFFNKYVKSAGEYWVRTFFNFLCMFKKHGIKLVCIFDGAHPPIEKKETQEQRIEQNDNAKLRLKRAIEICNLLKKEYSAFGGKNDDELDEDLQEECKKLVGTRRKNPRVVMWDQPVEVNDALRELISRLEKQTAPITDVQRSLAWDITQWMGVSVFQSEGEAEALCSYLAINGYVDGVLSEDSDVLAYGAPWMFAFKDYKLTDERLYAIHLPEVLEGLDYKMEEFLDLCILLSCDYNKRVKGFPPDGKKHKKACGIGVTGALAMIDEYRRLEKCEPYIEDMSPLIYERCREIFTTFNGEDYTLLIQTKPMNRKPNFGLIQEFIENEGLEDMIDLDYIKKCWQPTKIEIIEDSSEEEIIREIYVVIKCKCKNKSDKNKNVEFCVKFRNLKQYDKHSETEFDEMVETFNAWINETNKGYFIDVKKDNAIEAINVLEDKPEGKILDVTNFDEENTEEKSDDSCSSHCWDGGQCLECHKKLDCALCDKKSWETRCGNCDSDYICDDCLVECKKCGEEVCKVCAKEGRCICDDI